MGTRGSAGIIHKEKVYAVYNHFDSYPDGLGSSVVQFIKAVTSPSLEVRKEQLIQEFIGKEVTRGLLEEYEDGLNSLTKVKEGEYSHIAGLGGWPQLIEMISTVEEIDRKVPPTKEIQEKYQELGYANLGVSKQSPEDWYCLLREVQGVDTFSAIYRGNLKHIDNGANFFKDSLFCEWGYLINLDTMKLEVYRGFQKTAQKGNRFGEESNDDGYYPCALVGEFELDNIPADWENQVCPKEDDE